MRNFRAFPRPFPDGKSSRKGPTNRNNARKRPLLGSNGYNATWIPEGGESEISGALPDNPRNQIRNLSGWGRGIRRNKTRDGPSDQIKRRPKITPGAHRITRTRTRHYHTSVRSPFTHVN